MSLSCPKFCITDDSDWLTVKSLIGCVFKLPLLGSSSHPAYYVSLDHESLLSALKCQTKATAGGERVKRVQRTIWLRWPLFVGTYMIEPLINKWRRDNPVRIIAISLQIPF